MNSRKITDQYLEIGGHEYPIMVVYTYSEPYRGAVERGGLKIEPDYPGSIEIHKILIQNEQKKWVPFPYLKNVWQRVADDVLVEEQS